MTTTGVDLSTYNGNVNFNELKKDVDFVILKSGYGKSATQVAEKFEVNYRGAKAAGIPVGVYHYCYATSVAEAKQEAEACIAILRGKQLEFPVFYDVEENMTFARGKAVVSDIIRTFCGTLEAAGYYVGLYMSKAHLMSYVSEDVRNRYSVWVAQYYYECTYPNAYGMWQYSDDGRVRGVNGAVDMDKCYIDYEKIIKANGLNGFPKPEAPKTEEPKPEVPKPIEQPKPEAKKLPVVKKGDKGETVKIAQAILELKGYNLSPYSADGDFGNLTEKRVKEYQTKANINVTGIIDEQTWISLIGG